MLPRSIVKVKWLNSVGWEIGVIPAVMTGRVIGIYVTSIELWDCDKMVPVVDEAGRDEAID